MSTCPICEGQYEKMSPDGIRYFHACPEGRIDGEKFKSFRLRVDENVNENGQEKSPAIKAMTEAGERGLFISVIEEAMRSLFLIL